MSLEFNSVFGDCEVPFECPNCGKQVKIKIKNVGKSDITCIDCESNLDVKPANSFKSAKRTVDYSLKDFELTLKNFGK